MNENGLYKVCITKKMVVWWIRHLNVQIRLRVARESFVEIERDRAQTNSWIYQLNIELILKLNLQSEKS